MQVKDLIKDLEKGNRTGEMLVVKPESNSLGSMEMADSIRRLMEAQSPFFRRGTIGPSPQWRIDTTATQASLQDRAIRQSMGSRMASIHDETIAKLYGGI